MASLSFMASPRLLLAMMIFAECYVVQHGTSAGVEFQGRSQPKLNGKLAHLKRDQPYVVTYHNLLQTIIDLNIYWRRRDALFLIDNKTNLNMNRMTHYLKRSLPDWKLEIKQVDTGLNLTELLCEWSEIHLNFIVMCDDSHTDKITEVAALNGLFSRQHTWMIVSPHLPDILRSTVISGDTQVTLLRPQEQGHWDSVLSSSFAVDVTDVFYSHQTQKVEWIKFAIWTVNKRLTVFEILEARDSSEKLRGRGIRTAGFTHVPYVSVARGNQSLHFSGYSVDVMEIILEYFNVKYTTKEIMDYFGTFINGTYTGLIGSLFRKEADISLNILFMMPSRLEVTIFLTPVTKLDLAMAYRTPQSHVPPTTYLLPFSGALWLFVSSALLGMVILLAVIMLISPSWRSPKGSILSVDVHSKTFRILTGTYFEEVVSDPPGITARVTYATLVFTSMIIYIFYTSVFTSFLAYRELKMPIRNLRELIDSHKYSAITVTNTKYEDVFRRAQSGPFKELWLKMKKNEALCFQKSIFLATVKMYEGHNVFLGDGASIIAAMQNNCTISLLRTPFFHEYGHIVTRTDFPYSKIFSFRMLRLREGGLLRRLGRIYMTDSRPPCPVEDISLSFGLDQVQGVFMILLCGLILSLVSLVIEILTSILINSNKSNM